MTEIPLKNGFCDSFVSLRALCRQLDIDQPSFRRLSRDAESLYKHTTPEINGKTREIDNPSRELKRLQRSIARRLFRRIPWPEYLQGAICGRSARSNAAMHAGAAKLLKIDIKNYFPSITHNQVFKVWRELGFSSNLASHLTKLTTYNGYLPQGAPTSPSLANLVLIPFETQLVEKTSTEAHQYSRLIDDIAISGQQAQHYMRDAVGVVRRAGFQVKRSKTKIETKQSRQELTGFALNDGRPTISRSYRDEVRLRIHKLRHIRGRERQQEIRSILGCINYVGSVNRSAANRLASMLKNRVDCGEIEQARRARFRSVRHSHIPRPELAASPARSPTKEQVGSERGPSEICEGHQLVAERDPTIDDIR